MFSQRMKVGLVVIFLALSTLLTAFAWPQPAVEQPTIELYSAGMQAEDGRELTAADWVAHLPLAFATVVFVLVVDALFIGRIIYNRRRGKAGGYRS